MEVMKLKHSVGSASVSDASSTNEKEESTLKLTLKKDIYMFLLLLWEKRNNNGVRLFDTLPTYARQKIVLITLFAFIVQFSGLTYLASVITEYDVTTKYLYDCESVSESFTVSKYYDSHTYYNQDIDYSRLNNSIVLNNQKCNLFEDKSVYNQDVTASLYIGKLIAALVALAYTTEDYTAVARLSVIIPNSKIGTRWGCYGLFIAFGLSILGYQVFAIINGSNEAINILTVGISFILLMEIDNKVYDMVIPFCDIIEETQLNGQSLFQLKYNQQQLKYTLYENTSWVHKFDMVIISLTALCSLYEQTVFNFVYKRVFGSGSVYLVLVVGIGILIAVIPAFIIVGCILRKRYKTNNVD